MEIKITRVGRTALYEYKDILDKYNAKYDADDWEHFAIIEVKDIDALFTLMKELKQNLIMHWYDNEVRIYDDYAE